MPGCCRNLKGVPCLANFFICGGGGEMRVGAHVFFFPLSPDFAVNFAGLSGRQKGGREWQKREDAGRLRNCLPPFLPGQQ